MATKTWRLVLALTAGAILAAGTAVADDFYKGKTIKIVVGYTSGGGYDIYARLLARHMGKHIEGNPNVVVENMPGAGSLTAANYLFGRAPKDGTEFGTFSRTIVLTALADKGGNAKFKSEEFTWIGTPASYADDAYVLLIRSDIPIHSLDELRASGRVLHMGNTAPGTSDADITLLMAAILKLKVNEISGYPGGNSVSLAIERGEVDGRMIGLSSINSSMPHWLPNKVVRPLLQFARETRHPTMPDVPTARELAKGDKEALELVELAEMPFLLARPFAGPPGIPPERVKMLQEAFMKTNADPDYLAEAKKLQLDISPKNGEEVRKLVVRLGQIPPALMERYQAILSSGVFTPRTVNLIEVSGGKIVQLDNQGNKVRFESGGKQLHTDVDADGTDVRIADKKGKWDDLKVGMICDVNYEGDGTIATKLACK